MLIIPGRYKPTYCNTKCPCCYFNYNDDTWRCTLMKDTNQGIVDKDVTEYAEQKKRHPKCRLIELDNKEFEQSFIESIEAM